MKITRRAFSKSCAVLLGAAFVPRLAFAEDQVLDGSLPIEITSPGRYVLNSHQTVSLQNDPAILVSCNDVEIDLQGFRIENTYGAATSSVGIAAENGSRIRILNGEIRGFYAAVMLEDTDGGTYGHRIEGVTASNSTAIGFMVSGNGLVISQNTITNTGGTSLYGSCNGSMGIAVVRGLGCMILGNTLTFDEVGRVGIYVGPLAQDVVALENTVAGADHGFVFFWDSSTYRDNAVTGASPVPYTGGMNIGHNL